MLVHKPPTNHITLMVPVSDMVLECDLYHIPAYLKPTASDVSEYVDNNLKGYPAVDIAYVVKRGICIITMELDEDRLAGIS